MSVKGALNPYAKPLEELILTTSTDQSDQEESMVESATGNRKVKSAFASVLSTCSALKSAHQPSAQLPDQVRQAFENRPAARLPRKGYGEALLDGLGAGIKDCVDMVRHPIDTVIEPVCLFAKDVVALAAWVPDSPAGPVAKRRMQERFDAVVKMGESIADATGPERAELGTRLAVSMVVASKGVNVATGVVKSGRVATTTLIQTARRGATLPEKLPAAPMVPVGPDVTGYAKTLEEAFERVAGSTVSAEQLRAIPNPIHVVPRIGLLSRYSLEGLEVQHQSLAHLSDGAAGVSRVRFDHNPATGDLLVSAIASRSVRLGSSYPTTAGLFRYAHDVGESMESVNRIFLQCEKGSNISHFAEASSGIQSVSGNPLPFASRQMNLFDITGLKSHIETRAMFSYPEPITHVVMPAGANSHYDSIHHFFIHGKGREIVVNIPVLREKGVFRGVLQAESSGGGGNYLQEQGLTWLSGNPITLDMEEICKPLIEHCMMVAEWHPSHPLKGVGLDIEGLGMARQIDYSSVSLLIPKKYPVVQPSLVKLFPVVDQTILESLPEIERAALRMLLDGSVH